MTHTKEKINHLDNVCIVQKYYENNKVLECRENFNKSEQFIVNAVNCHDDLLESLKLAIDYIDNNGEVDHEWMRSVINKAEGR